MTICSSILYQAEERGISATQLLDEMRQDAQTTNLHGSWLDTYGNPLQTVQREDGIGVYSLGKAQRVIRLIRDAGYHQPLYIHGALQKLCDYYESQGRALGDLRPATVDAGAKGDFAGAIVLGPPSAFGDKWARRFPDPLVSFASGWMQVRARARQRNVELPLIISDHADWNELTRTVEEVNPLESWTTHGREEALLRWHQLNQRRARALALVGYEDEDD